MTPADLIKKYIELRDWLERDTKAVEERQKPYRDAMATIEGAIQKHLLDNNLDNVKSEFGTAYRTSLMSVKLADRGALLKYIVDNTIGEYSEMSAINAAEIAAEAVAAHFTAALSKEKIREYVDSTGAAPAGVDITTIQKVGFRRS